MHICQLITSYEIINRKTKRRFSLIPKVINSNYVRKKKLYEINRKLIAKRDLNSTMSTIILNMRACCLFSHVWFCVTLWTVSLEGSSVHPWDSPSKNTGMDFHPLLQGSWDQTQISYVSCIGS